MKNIQLVFTIVILFCTFLVKGQKQPFSKDWSFISPKSIFIEVRLKARSEETFVIHYSPVEYIGNGIRKWKTIRQQSSNGIAKWVLNTEEPIFVSLNDIFKDMKISKKRLLLEPSDRIEIIPNGQHMIFSGKGSEKLYLQYKIDSALETVPKPTNPSDYSVNSLNDYFEWHYYLNKRLNTVLPIIESFRPRISEFAYNYIRADFIDQNIDDRSDKFGVLLWSYAKANGISNESICAIYDSTYLPATTELFNYVTSYKYGSWKPILFQVNRSYGFESKNEAINSELKKKLLWYDVAIEKYKGRIREKFIADFLIEELIAEHGFVSEIENRLHSYYSEIEYPEYKQYVRNNELRERDKGNSRKAADFKLFNSNDESFTKKDITGKIAIFDFWFTGCVGCLQMAPALQKIEKMFRNDTSIMFISVSIDKEKNKWLKSVAQKKFTTGNGINLYTGGEGKDHSMIKDYGIHGYPSIVIIDPYGRLIVQYPKPDPRKNNGKEFLDLLTKQLNISKDGPYVMYDYDKTQIYSINGSTLSTKKFTNIDFTSLPVQIDSKATFNVRLKKELKKEVSEFAMPQKLLALSDIEGNFDAFRKLLQANKVIDENYDWIFGNGHLVFAGDMFDRGQQVTECLWLLYSLEEKAKASGGYVHFILGNHEIMNLQGNHRYVQPKYMNNAKLIGKTLKELYGENSELGRWLRTKNIIERIGNLLFLHGGLAKEFSDSVTTSINEINNIARKYIGERINEREHPDKNVRFIYSTSYSPFWFRQYYEDDDKHMWLVSNHSVRWTIEKPDEKEMNSILKRWNVNRIITGHTVVADTVSLHYGGKVINIDTKHSDGKSEALFIEGNKYYRVNQVGVQELLFVDEADVNNI